MLSKKTKYAINALVYIARRDASIEKPVQISEISEEQNIPRKFLESILLELKKAGILDSKKGRAGGYFLIRPTQDVNLAEIHRLFDGAIGLLPCVTYQYYEKCEECKDEEVCGIRESLLQVRNTTVEILKKSNLQSIIQFEDNKLLE